MRYYKRSGIAAAGIAAGLAGALFAGQALAAPVVLRASHQFPGGKGDVRDDMVQMIAKVAKAANVDLDIQVYPGASLFKPEQQWNAMVNGQLDITLFPLDYASGQVRDFSATLMPGLVRNYDRAKPINKSKFMTAIRASIEKNGVMVLSDAWFGGGMASKRGCITTPDDVKGLKFRAAGPTFAQMWQSAGASIVSVPSNEIYNAFQTGVAEATDTSMGSFLSFRLYEQAKCLTVPGDNALWMMYEPLLMSKKTFEKLDKSQQRVLLEAGRKAQKYYEDKAEAVDAATIKAYKDHGVQIKSLSKAEFDKWIDVARRSSYAEFSKDVPDGKKLIDEALSVK
ncbi:MAG TPA: TRAP transporter substrate-binding protein DctP [Burkholderiales bacterium]|nr:TRAP transporter substrate-binding protein DctP [Burkholderiales bacterium]